MEKLGLITVRFFVLFEVHFPNYVEKELEKEGSFNCISTDLVQIIQFKSVKTTPGSFGMFLAPNARIRKLHVNFTAHKSTTWRQ